MWIFRSDKRFMDMMVTAENYFASLNGAGSASPTERDELKQRLDELIMPFSDDPAYQAFLRMRSASQMTRRRSDASSGPRFLPNRWRRKPD